MNADKMWMISRAGLVLQWTMILGCPGLPATSEPEVAPRVQGLTPGRVRGTDPVRLLISEPLSVAGPGWPVEVHDATGRPLAVSVRGTADALEIRPISEWPEGMEAQVVLTGPLYTGDGRRFEPVDPEAWWFVVASTARSIPAATVAGPRSGPANSRWLLVEGPNVEAPFVLLTGHGPPVRPRVHRASGGRILVEVMPGAGECERLCPGIEYAVRWMPGDLDAGRVGTSTLSDRTPPVIEWVDVRARGSGIEVRVRADEAIVVQGWLHTEGHDPVALAPPWSLGRLGTATAVGLAPETEYRLDLEISDLAGHAVSVEPWTVRTPPTPRVAISEVVTTPLRDWSDSEGGAVPFDASPGTGAVNDNDEWVELVNLSDEPLDLIRVGLELEAVDSSPSVTVVDGAPGLHFGAGGTLRHWQPGEALVVRPRGSLSQRDLRLELRGPGGLLDLVRIGGVADPDHPGGPPPDAHHESVAQDGEGQWQWCVPTPGDPRPAVNCR